MKVINKNILTVDYGLIVHQVNTKGVMGAGLAKDIKRKFPVVYGAYKLACDLNQLPVGDVQIVEVSPVLSVCNLAAQERYGRDRAYTLTDAFEQALIKLRGKCDCRGSSDNQIYFPYKIGCGLGGGDWEVISKLLDKYFPYANICKI